MMIATSANHARTLKRPEDWQQWEHERLEKYFTLVLDQARGRDGIPLFRNHHHDAMFWKN